VIEISAPPRRIVTDRLLLRPYKRADAPLLKDAVDSSLEHLREFMNWAWFAPEPLGVIEERMEEFGRAFDREERWIYAMFARDGSELLGGAGLHRRVGPEALEIGYWLRASRVGRGLATEAAAALTRVALECCHAVRVEIHIDPANAASLAIPARLGYVLDATLRRRLPPIRDGEERRDAMVFSILDEEYPASPAAKLQTAQFDRPAPGSCQPSSL
jgi:RimJ/RimL family protein N-acetyltransferase